MESREEREERRETRPRSKQQKRLKKSRIMIQGEEWGPENPGRRRDSGWRGNGSAKRKNGTEAPRIREVRQSREFRKVERPDLVRGQRRKGRAVTRGSEKGGFGVQLSPQIIFVDHRLTFLFLFWSFFGLFFWSGPLFRLCNARV